MSVKSKITQSNMELEVNLVDMFDTEVTSDSTRQAIGQAIIDRIVERTQSGTTLSGGKMKGYSKAYKESLAFKIAGKSSPNLTLAGDMLGLMDIKSDTESKIVIGWDPGVQNDKAYNHHTGDTLPARPFFGLQKQELQEIIEEFKEEVTVRGRLVEAGESGETKFRETAVAEIRRILSGEE